MVTGLKSALDGYRVKTGARWLQEKPVVDNYRNKTCDICLIQRKKRDYRVNISNGRYRDRASSTWLQG